MMSETVDDYGPPPKPWRGKRLPQRPLLSGDALSKAIDELSSITPPGTPPAGDIPRWMLYERDLPDE